MSSSATPEREEDGPSERPLSDEELAMQVELLVQENHRLRTQTRQARVVNHRRGAIGLAVLGGLSILSAVAFAGSRETLIAIGATGLFAAVLTAYLTADEFVPMSIVERLYLVSAINSDDLLDELGLSSERVYVPMPEERNSGVGSVRLFVPQRPDYILPPRQALTERLVAVERDASRGVSFEPNGTLFVKRHREEVLSDNAEPADIARSLSELVTERLGLARTVTLAPDTGQEDSLTLSIEGCACRSADRFDHPVVSIFATGLADSMGVPVTVVVTDSGDTVRLECEWSERPTDW